MRESDFEEITRDDQTKIDETMRQLKTKKGSIIGGGSEQNIR